jgi:hypothetical protein
MPYPPGIYEYLTDRGTLFYNGQIPNASRVGRAVYMGGAALEMDWKGRVLWEVNHPAHNHDEHPTTERKRSSHLREAASG